jgi:hypothetical protein
MQRLLYFIFGAAIGVAGMWVVSETTYCKGALNSTAASGPQGVYPTVPPPQIGGGGVTGGPVEGTVGGPAEKK